MLKKEMRKVLVLLFLLIAPTLLLCNVSAGQVARGIYRQFLAITDTPTPSATATSTETPTQTVTVTPTITPTLTPTIAPTATPTITRVPPVIEGTPGPKMRIKWPDIAYATVSASQKMDIYLPGKGHPPFPVIMYIHGGGFYSGDKSIADFALPGLDHGYAIASINYRLSEEAKFPAQINDVKAAIRFIHRYGGAYDLDPEKIALWGSSAGGMLAALAGTSGGVNELADLNLGYADSSDRVRAVVDWYGPINFLTADAQFKASGIKGYDYNAPDSYASQLMGTKITTVPDKVMLADPETYISPDDPPFFIQHGSADVSVPFQQSIEFAYRLRSVLGEDKVYFGRLPGAGHGGAAFTTAKNVDKVLAWLDRMMK